jgi:hypothetical protein
MKYYNIHKINRKMPINIERLRFTSGYIKIKREKKKETNEIKKKLNKNVEQKFEPSF